MTGLKLIGYRIDIETRSRVNLKFGAYVYSECPDFDILICAYIPVLHDGHDVKMGQPRLVDLDDVHSIHRFKKILLDDTKKKWAFNANFERVCLSRWLGYPVGTYLDPKNWFCTAIRANAGGVFGSLDEVAKALGSPIAKDPKGKSLIRLFSIPDKATGQFHDPKAEACWCSKDHRQQFTEYEEYCKQDTRTEALVDSLLPEPPRQVQHEFELDQRINDTGIRHFKSLSAAAVTQVAKEKDRLMDLLTRLTGLENPNSVQQFRGWTESQGYPMESLDKASRAEALADPTCPDLVKTALELKGAASLSSVSKHTAALDTRSADGRIRGSLRFYGAHTGREAGRGIQPQNMPSYEASAADRVRLLNGTAGPDAPEIAKGTARASLVPKKDHVFVVFDYNAIEARVLAGLAGEKWVEEEFRGQGKIYEATAATMFNVSKQAIIDGRVACGECKKCEWCRLRGSGKVSNLALGYAGGAGALVQMGAEREGIDIGNFNIVQKMWEDAGKPCRLYEFQPEMHDYPALIELRDTYRSTNPMTVRFWKLCAAAFDKATLTGETVWFGQHNCLKMSRDGRHTRMILPSGRSIWYRNARVTKDKDTGRVERRTYMGKGPNVGHVRIDTHGGKLTENVTQAVARDVLFDLLKKIEKAQEKGWPGRVVLHVHDEVVVEVHKDHVDEVYADLQRWMSTPPKWAQFLLVKGAGEIMKRYGK